jgi:carboxypeptidase Q
MHALPIRDSRARPRARCRARSRARPNTGGAGTALRRALTAAAFATAAGRWAAPAVAQSPPGPAPLANPSPLAAAYQPAVERITHEALGSRAAYERLAILCDHFGNRLSGTPQLEAAIAWAAAELRADGLANVRLEPVMVPVWVRGEERAFTLEPARHKLSILGLGGSVGTPPGGITAALVVVGSFAEADSLGRLGRLREKIVLYDVPFTSYGETVRYRGGGPSNAAKHGAVAALVRSVGPISYDTPHTGALRYAPDVPSIPAAAVTIENATMLRRMQQRGDAIQVHLEMDAHMLPDAPSANLLGEIVGRELPQEIVVIGGHIDSWDVGQGAQDDGVGCILSMAAAQLIKRLDLKPRRTIRVVLFTNEENGLRGGNAYRDAHRAELRNHVAMLETDSGNGPVLGFRLHLPPLGAPPTNDGKAETPPAAAGPPQPAPGSPQPAPGAAATPEDPPVAAAKQRALDLLAEVGQLLAPLGATTMHLAGSGADVGPSVEAGGVGIGVEHDIAHYFDVHHTWADTFDKVDAGELAHNVACVTALAYVLADMPGRLLVAPAPPPPAR